MENLTKSSTLIFHIWRNRFLRADRKWNEIFQATPLLRYLINSVVITLPAVFFAIALATLGGYALAKFKFRGLPPVAMFFVLQRQFIAGLTLGAVK